MFNLDETTEGPGLPQQFASDNYSGICPEAWSAMEAANHGHVPAYGDDRWTAIASNTFRRVFETECEVFFAFNGTAANSLALASLCQSYHGVICCDSAHVETDECGAPELFSNGSKLLVAHSDDGKLTPTAIHEIATKRQDIHYPKPRAVTITQSTETGRVYTVDELRAISSACQEHGLRLHMDGARFANACASVGCSPAELSWKSGVDVLCFGGTKNGMAVGEAILFFDKELAKEKRSHLSNVTIVSLSRRTQCSYRYLRLHSKPCGSAAGSSTNSSEALRGSCSRGTQNSNVSIGSAGTCRSVQPIAGGKLAAAQQRKEVFDVWRFRCVGSFRWRWRTVAGCSHALFCPLTTAWSLSRASLHLGTARRSL